MRFGWDIAKEEAVFREGGIGFPRASRTFEGEIVCWKDSRGDHGEVRFCALGCVDEVVPRVVFTLREEDLVWIITAWKANRKERTRWRQR